MKGRVLIVDDDADIREMLRFALEDAGYAVLEAVDGNDALRQVEATPVDLVVTDIIMPGKEGIETVFDLRRKYRGLKIIAMSGGGRAGNLEFLKIAKSLGADHVATKPIDVASLVDATHRLVGAKAR